MTSTARPTASLPAFAAALRTRLESSRAAASVVLTGTEGRPMSANAARLSAFAADLRTRLADCRQSDLPLAA